MDTLLCSFGVHITGLTVFSTSYSLDPEMVTTSSQALKDDGISIISLGLRSPQGVTPAENVNIKQLQNVASSASHVVVTSNPSDVASFSDLVSLICTGKRT